MTEIRAHLIGDIHMSDRHMSLTEEALINTLDYVRSDRDVNFICVMGDIFDTHRTLKMDHRNKAVDFIKELSKIKPTFVIIGNHDRMNNRDYLSDIHPFYGMNDITGELYFINEPRMVRFNSRHYVLFMPYVPPGRFKEAITSYISDIRSHGTLPKNKGLRDIALVCAHQEFMGVHYGPIKSTAGDEWPIDYPTVVSGHIHHRHTLQKNIYYTGSLYPITMGEEMDKGVITMTYNPESRYLDIKCKRVVSSGKNTIMIKATDSDAVREMLTLDRSNTRYIISGTGDEMSVIKNKVKGKSINWVPDITVPEVSIDIGRFDDMIRGRVDDALMIELLDEIIKDN